MKSLALSAVAFLGSGLLILAAAAIGLDLGASFVSIVAGCQVAAFAVLAVTGFRPVGFVVVWVAAIAVLGVLLVSIESSFELASIAAAGFFGSCAMLLWLVVALPARVILLGIDQHDPRPAAVSPASGGE